MTMPAPSASATPRAPRATRLAALLAFALATAAVAAPAAQAADDHPNTKTGALALTPSTPRTGRIEVAGDVDFFALDVVRMNVYTIETVLQGLPDSVLEVYDTDGTTRLLENDDVGGNDLSSRVVWQPLGTGRAYVRVRGYDASTGAYTVRVSVAAAPSGSTSATSLFPPPPGDDHWSTAERATQLAVDEWIYARIDRVGDVDTFSFATVMGARYAVETHLLTLPDSGLALLDPDFALVLADNDDYGPWAAFPEFAKAARVDWTAPRASRYYVQVGGRGNAVGTYRLRVRTLAGGEYPAAPGSIADDVGDTTLTATPLADGQTFRARADRTYDLDEFRVELVAGRPVRVQTGSITITATVITLEDDQGRPLARASTPFYGSRLDYTPQRTGTFFVRVEPVTGYRGEYWVRAQQGVIADSGFDEVVHQLRAGYTTSVDFAAAEVARLYFLSRPPPEALSRVNTATLWSRTGLGASGALGAGLVGARFAATPLPAASATASALNTALVAGKPVTLLLSGTDLATGATVRHAVLVMRAAQIGTRIQYAIYDPKDQGADLNDVLAYDTATRTFAAFVHGGVRFTQAMTAAAAGLDFGLAGIASLPAGPDLATRVTLWLRKKVTGV